MDIDAAVESIDHLFFVRQRGQDTQFDLRVVGRDEHVPLRRLERFADEMKKRSDEAAEKPEMWYLIDKKLHSLGIFIGEDEDIDERVEHTKQLRKEEGRKFRDY